MNTSSETRLTSTVRIDRKYCGPSNSGNGGYVSGIIAKAAPFSAEVTLRLPPPLDKDLILVQTPDRVELLDGDQLVGEAVPVEFDLEVPPPPDFEAAVAASKKYSGFHEHPFPNCFVCGVNRQPGDGLNIFAGKIAPDQVAAPWVPHAGLSSDGRVVDFEYHWAALDCPGGWTYLDPARLIVLGRMAVKIVEKVKVNEKHIVFGWNRGVEGRKIYTGTAVFRADGTLCAFARATWIALKKS
ncbi:MAG: hypothetical protein D6714_17850 [Bacteroidetes bacterium]|nr:MAG: hypothetical protein D6714_17850 [Bacteroidota bacterium]